MLEHGAVWITYNPKTATAADITKLKSLVNGVDRMALSPYAGLKTPISLQSWDYQLFVNRRRDPRVSEVRRRAALQPEDDPGAGRQLLGSLVQRSAEHARPPVRGLSCVTRHATIEPDLEGAGSPRRRRHRDGAASRSSASRCWSLAVGGGVLWGSSGDNGAGRCRAPSSVDAGFARDMSTHHQQAITMAGYARDNSDEPSR